MSYKRWGGSIEQSVAALDDAGRVLSCESRTQKNKLDRQYFE